MDDADEITVTLTRAEAHALLYAHDINEFPVSNPLGREGDDLLAAAEAKLRAELRDDA
jgi:hypothetical protein